MNKKRLIYVAGKYTDPDAGAREENIAMAEIVGANLINEGWNVFIPHKNFGGMEVFAEDYPNINERLFYELTADILLRCDAVYMVHGWEESAGARMEYELAIANGIEIYIEDSTGTEGGGVTTHSVPAPSDRGDLNYVGK